MSVEYPSDLPMSELLEAIKVVQAGDFKNGIDELAHDLWVIQGYAQKMLIGAPTSAQAAEGFFDESDDLFAKVQKAADYLQQPSSQAVPVELLKVIFSWATEVLLQLLTTYVK